MKNFKQIFSFILTLSLSALYSYPKFAYETNTNITQDNTNIFLISTENENSQNNFIDISSNEYIEVFSLNDKLVYLTQEDIYLMSQIVYAESKGEPFEGKIAVASVILNRVLSPGFPNTVEEVIFQPNAFSCVVNNEITVSPSQECFDAVYEAINGHDPTREALFFYNPEIATCSWMDQVDKTNITPIGNHVFFSLY
jgi:N-acetylmuramoyl-L-alanine amidase